jgi:hypothetical protein
VFLGGGYGLIRLDLAGYDMNRGKKVSGRDKNEFERGRKAILHI